MKVYRPLESFLVRITLRAAMATSWLVPALGHLINNRRWVKPPSTRGKSSLDCRSWFSWGLYNPNIWEGDVEEGQAIQEILWASGTIFLAKVLDRLNTGGALLDPLLTNKKELVREWQSMAALVVVSEIEVLRILTKKMQLLLLGKQGLPWQGFFWDSRWVSNKQALIYAAATK